jgi:hypothetical protein
MTYGIKDRSKRCAAAIRDYNGDDDARTNLIDFLADARHWCDRNRESYAELDRQAYRHYSAERVDARRQS